MRKIHLLEHVSLDGFMAGSKSEINWIRFDEELADYVGEITKSADAALYGRITYEMMESYWPTAADKPGASRHDIEHANWVNKAEKIVFSKSLQNTSWHNTRIIKDNIVEEMSELKNRPGKDLLLIGSASIAHVFMQHNIIDEYWINVNPVILGTGLPLFKNISGNINLNLVQVKTFGCGVAGLHYKTR
ncbi:MAG: dihydrofolate reductase family protein [Ignavibacteriaceae bacterium]|nr:dihydrofolate reductase family protein [Ignavibacteriaceae bacterium]